MNNDPRDHGIIYPKRGYAADVYFSREITLTRRLEFFNGYGVTVEFEVKARGRWVTPRSLSRSVRRMRERRTDIQYGRILIGTLGSSKANAMLAYR